MAASCQPTAPTPSPHAPAPTATVLPEVSARATPDASAPVVASTPAVPRGFAAELAIRCWTQAIEKLGWLPAGAHTGQFIQTAHDAGMLSADCKPLAAERFPRGLPLEAGGTLQWSREKEEPRGQSIQITIRFYCPKAECAVAEERVIVLPRTWHCFGWIHGPEHGSACFRSAAACATGQKRVGRETTPCRRHSGAAYCSPKSKLCYPSPWDCGREAGGGIRDGGCVRTDR